jgi:hypothetical protein
MHPNGDANAYTIRKASIVAVLERNVIRDD